MTKKPRTVGPDKPVGYALHMMYENGFRHVPVVENGRPVVVRDEPVNGDGDVSCLGRLPDLGPASR